MHQDDDTSHQVINDFQQGISRLAQFDYRRAIAYFSHAIQKAPCQAKLFIRRAEARFFSGDLPGAEQDCSTALELDPTLSMAYYWRARVRKKNIDWRGAVADYRQYLRLCANACDDHRAEVEQSIRDLERQLQRTP